MALSWTFAVPVCIGILIGVFSPSLVEQINKKVPKPVIFDEIVMFGDSITQQAWSKGGVGAALTNAYQRKLSVLCSPKFDWGR